MKKRKNEDEGVVLKTKMEKGECSLDDLPKTIVLLFCSHFLDLDSILNFSSINKKYRNLFSEFLKNFGFLKQSQFLNRNKHE